MHYTKEWTIEVREDIFNQIKVENDLLVQENVELRNKLELTIRLCAAWEKATTENEKLLRDAEKKTEELEETIKDHQLYEEKLEHRIIEFEELLHWE